MRAYLVVKPDVFCGALAEVLLGGIVFSVGLLPFERSEKSSRLRRCTVVWRKPKKIAHPVLPQQSHHSFGNVLTSTVAVKGQIFWLSAHLERGPES